MWLNPLALAGKTPRKQMMRRRWAFFRPVVEVLEDRTAPAMLTVTNALDPTALTAGTLRYAVNQANADANAGQSDTIVFSGVSNVTLAQGQLELSGYDASTPATITIDGGGQVTIDGNHASRIFQVDAGVRVIVAGLTIEHGYATGSDAMGGGIYNSGTLTVSNSTLSSNSAVGSYQGVGGGIYNSGMLTVSGSTIQANLATGPTFNGVCSGGGISNDGTLVLENSQLIDNTTGPGGVGGGIDNSGPLTVSGCTLSGNSANYEGGGIQNSAVSSDNATVINSTLSGNSAGDFGGGIANNVSLTVVSSTLTDNSTPNYGGGAANFGALSVINSTFSGNSAYQGGGIANPGTLTVTNSTLSGNSGSNSGGGIYNDTNGSTSLNNSIVANSTSGHDLFSASANIGALFGSNDLIGDGSYISTPSSDITDSISANPLLAPLGNYGGPTQTMALLPGSPALGAGSVALAVDGSGNALTTDQRGQPRIVGSAVDIGAFESQGFVLAVTGGADQTALPGAAFASPLGLSVTANNDLEPVNGGVVTFTAPSAGASATLSATSATISSGSASVTATANGTTGSYTVNATAGATTGPAVFDLTNTITEASIQQALSPTTPVTVQANASTDADEVINAVNELPSYSTAVTVTLNLAAGTSYSDLNPGPPAGVTLVINGQGGTTTIVGSSPALTVSSGTVIVTGMTLTTATAAPTVLVTGGSLQLRNDDIESSTGSTEACISLTGGSLDLGTPTDPGGNVFNINGTGTWFANTTSNPILFSGDTFEINGIVQAVGFTVANSNDSGPGSLRQALEDNNLLGGSNTITFDIPMTDPGYDPTTGTFTIAPLSALPVITTPVVIDGTSEASVTGHSGSPLIVFSGVNAGSGAVGLEVTGGGSTVKGLVINQFGGDGIDLTTNGGDVVEGDFIGTDATGSSAAGNGRQGVSIASADNTIGGTTADARNIISGNGAFDSSLFSAAGVYLYGAGATGNVIEGNYIGTDATGTMAVANLAGVFLDGTTGNTIGGAAPGAGNVISGNSLDGVELLGSSGAVVQGNFIGTDKTGTVALGNNYGVLLYGAATDNTIGGTALGAGNLISGNGAGVAIGGTGDSGSSGNVVQGNFIGTDITGTTALGNYYGIGISGDNSNTIGGAAAGARNVISGNIVGVSIQGNSNVVQGNYIGVDISGNKALGNGRDGIDINGDSNIVGVDSSNNPAARNVISGNGDNGVALAGSDNLIAGNLVGLGADGSTVLGNRNWGIGHWGGGSGNTIGGTTAAARNVVSGNGSTGIGVGNADGTSGDVIEGNYIGTDVTGLLARPNGAYGVWFLGSGANTLGGTTLGAGNVISGNGTGVYLSDGTTGVVIAGNLIGVNAAGTAAIGNYYAGVLINGPSGAAGPNAGGSADNTIGGTVAGSANVISGNGADGYDVTITPTAGTGNMVEGNYIGTGVTGTPAPATGPHPFVVTSTADSGPGSLRQTILQADAYYGTASISFALPASGPGYNAATGTWTITPASALPVITEGVILDATTQPGYAGRPVVELDGANAGVGVSGLVITGGNATIKGLDIGGFSQDGIELGINNGNLIEGNYIGTDLSGAVALGNGGNGILIEDGSSGNTIGGIAPGDGNVIGGNGNGPGVQIIGGGSSGSSGNVVEGNLIGTDASGTRDLGNLYGVYITGGGDNTIGGAAAGARNVISGNSRQGVYLINSDSNYVQGNYIGVNESGNVALGNLTGIDVQGGQFNVIGVDASNNPAAGNVISGNSDYGVGIEAGSNNVVAGNVVGLGADGSTVVGNRYEGIAVDFDSSGDTIGGTTAAARNVVSGNGEGGIIIGNADGTSGNVIEGNYVGTDATGMAARPNGQYAGVWFIGAGANTLGGTAPGAGNVISGNAGGVYLSDGTTGVVIAGNLIGLNATGAAALGNQLNGVAIGGPSGAVGNNTGGSTDNTVGAGNVISGNGGNGVEIVGSGVTGNVVAGNTIDANALNGVYVTSSAAGNTIGGTAAGAANLIAFNTGAGVAVEGATSIGNPIEGNSIHDNGGLGIDLVSGANDNQATPALTAATTFALGTSVAGMLVSAPDTSFRIEFFSNAAPDPSGNGQGQTYLGSATVTTDENGNATIDATGLAALPAGQTYISATATNLATGDTSEFSHDVLIQVVTSTTLSSSVTPSVYGQPVTLTATVSYPGGGSAPTGTVTFTDGSTTLGVGTVSTSGGITTASYTTTATQLPVGANQTITASYSGDGTFPPSSGTTSQTIVATPLLENGVLAIPGTATAAAYTLTPVLPTGASAYSMKVTRTIGTTTTNLGTFAVSSGNVEVYGGPGTYAVTLRGTANSDAFTAGSGTVINEVAAQATAQATSFTVGLNSVAAFTINGAGGNDSLTGPNQANSWAITGANAGTLDGIATFTGIGNLTGGSGADTFSFADGGSVSGTIDGGGGSNTLDFSSRTTAVTVTLVAGGPNKATATGGWTNIATVIGSAATTDALVGANTTNVWDLTGTNAGSLNGTLAFSGFENLTGGSTNDTFAFFPGGSIAGNLKGGAPINTLDYSDYGSPVAVNLVAKTATGIGGTWATVQNFIGTGTTDTLVGANTNSTWSITGTNAGTVGAYSFAGFPYLTGGSGNNTFAFSAGAAVSGTITGGAGSNTLDYSGYGSPVTVNLQTTTATGIGGTWANIQSFKGTNTTDTLNATDGTTNTWALKGNNAGTVDGVAFTAFANLTGGSGADVFQFANGATVSGIVNGQGGTNTLDYSAYTGGVTVNLGNATTGLPNSSATGVNGGAANGIVNIGNVVVGAGNNYLTAVGAAISVTFTATGNGNNILVGGSGSNTLTASGSGNNIVIGDHGTSTISGGTGYNLLIGGYTAYDAVYADLQSILGIWKTVSSAKTYSKAIANLTASSYAYALTAASVTGNAGDTINAGTHVLDWYFAEAVNEITGENAGETVTLC